MQWIPIQGQLHTLRQSCNLDIPHFLRLVIHPVSLEVTQELHTLRNQDMLQQVTTFQAIPLAAPSRSTMRDTDTWVMSRLDQWKAPDDNRLHPIAQEAADLAERTQDRTQGMLDKTPEIFGMSLGIPDLVHLTPELGWTLETPELAVALNREPHLATHPMAIHRTCQWGAMTTSRQCHQAVAVEARLLTLWILATTLEICPK